MRPDGDRVAEGVVGERATVHELDLDVVGGRSPRQTKARTVSTAPTSGASPTPARLDVLDLDRVPGERTFFFQAASSRAPA